MTAEVTADQAAELLADAINQAKGTVPSAEAMAPLPPPSGLLLLGMAAGRYRPSLTPWGYGLLLVLAGVIAGEFLSLLLALAGVPVLAVVFRTWTAVRLARRNERVRSGKDPDGRTVRVDTVARRKARATAVGAAVGLWLSVASAVGHTVGFGGTVGVVFWASAVGLWAALSVPAWNATDARRSTGQFLPTVGEFDPSVGTPDGPHTDGSPTAPTVWATPAVGSPAGTPDGPARHPSVGTPTVYPSAHPTAPDTRRSTPPTVDTRRPRRVSGSAYDLPSLDLLAVGTQPPRRPTGVADSIAKTIDGTLREHGVGGKVVGDTVGPTVTRYAVALNRGVKVSAFMALEANLTKALRLADPISLLKSVPGRDAVGIDVPNRTRTAITLGDILRSVRATLDGYALGIGIGCTVDGQPVVVDLADLPHLLIGGATGAGKSVSLNALIVSLLMFHGPDTLGLLLIDPKRVELTKYRNLPHLIGPIAKDFDTAVAAFEGLTAEMDDRYRTLEDAGCRNITEYNRGVAAGRIAGGRMRHIAAICDEVVELILESRDRRKAARRDEDPGPDLEQLIVRLLQLARAAGIHLVLATQRPSADVIKGLISANLPARLAFMVAKLADSMVILGLPGAEKLLGRGDGLWQPPGNTTTRIQGASVTDEEIDAVVAFWSSLGAPRFDRPAVAEQPRPTIRQPLTVPAERLARDVVLEAAQETAGAGGLVDKRQIVAATPGMRPGTRDKALTDLVEAGLLERPPPTGRGVYLVVDLAADNDVAGATPAGDGEPQ